MKTRPSIVVRLAFLLGMAAWVTPPWAAAQTPVTLSLRVVDGQSQLTVTGAVGDVCQIQWTEDLSSPARWFHFSQWTVTEPPGFVVDSTSTANARRYYRAVSTPSTNLVWIPPGTFAMGSPANELDRRPNEGPQTQVTLSRGFWMGQCEVTQGEYQAVMGSNPSWCNGDRTAEGGRDYGFNTNRPVEMVSWLDAANYCEALTQRERAAGRIPPNSAFRLPTEAEWEYACRAGTSTRFSYGDDPSYTSLATYAWFGDVQATTHSVGQKPSNPWGLHDTHGNVWEWCQDWFGEYPGGTAIDPQGPDSGTSGRVFRGGGSSSLASACRSASRNSSFSFDSFSHVGFRVVLALDQP